MSEEIRTLKKAGSYEFETERSRFITHAWPVFSRDEAEEIIAETREKYRDATHNVPAFIIGEKGETKWSSDDGEPGGSAGAPVLGILDSKSLTNSLIIVTRYFGGIKLGVGGLVRAYSHGAEMAVQDAEIAVLKHADVLTCVTDYSSYNRISRHDFDVPVFIENVEYGEKVRFSAIVESENAKNLKNSLRSLSNGDILFESAKMILRAF
jgi:uncharacterized YigZ family protein